MAHSGQPISGLIASEQARSPHAQRARPGIANRCHKFIKHVNMYLILLNMILTFFVTGATVMDKMARIGDTASVAVPDVRDVTQLSGNCHAIVIQAPGGREEDFSTMIHTHEVDGSCPVCGNAMYISHLSCDRCGSSLEGAFSLSGQSTMRRNGAVPAGRESDERFGRLARLNDQQLEFVEVFLRCRGTIKDVEDMLGISYPTVKSRLANVLEAMGFAGDEKLTTAPRHARRDILGRLATGEISTEEAHRLLAEVRDDDDEG
jgi:hypothetical protein